jgi:5-methylcytosine-specific restriction endonuclease McrA
MSQEYKLCPRCQQKKHKSEYHTRKYKGYTHLKSYCKKCCNEKAICGHYDLCECGNKKTKKSAKCIKCTRTPYDQITSTDCIKKTIIRDKLLPYECQECGNTGEHLGKPLSLHLDHINGKNKDHRLENLRFLCPNCHSQTDTYCGRNTKWKKPK